MDAQTETTIRGSIHTYIERSRRKFIHSSIPDEGVIAVKAYPLRLHFADAV